MTTAWCEQKDIHEGFVRVAAPKSPLIAPECMGCGTELDEPYYYDIQNAEPICDECHATRSAINEPKPDKPKRSKPRPPGQPIIKKKGRKKKDDE